MKQGRPPISGRTSLYGLFADPIEHLQTPSLLNELLDRRGVDGVFLPLHVTPEHLTEAVAGTRHIRNFCGYCVSIPHKAMAAGLCDELLPNAKACGVVNSVRIVSCREILGRRLEATLLRFMSRLQRTQRRSNIVPSFGTGIHPYSDSSISREV